MQQLSPSSLQGSGSTTSQALGGSYFGFGGPIIIDIPFECTCTHSSFLMVDWLCNVVLWEKTKKDLPKKD
jgi:hypothetical protein